jgi:diadenosine tetraphosphatase ApaH/serine/threonine PP2A family protein phosphatase
MLAILSDVHGNLEALTAVLADAKAQGATSIYNLGDLVGYCSNPVECVEIAMKWDVNLMGNFDYAAVHTPDGFGHYAEQSILWTTERLRAARGEQLLKWFDGLPKTHAVGDFLFVHGSARNPLNEYLFPEDVYNQPKLNRIGERFERFCFGGHTHVPGVFVQSEAGEWEYAERGQHGQMWRIDGRKTIVNVGSVGQPRDENWRACYTLVYGWDAGLPHYVNA